MEAPTIRLLGQLTVLRDGAPVDLLFVLLVPEAATDAHLELLRQIASMLDRQDVRERLRQASSGEDLYQVVVDIQNGH